ncbi:TPA: polysaccharide biosynthesis protein [Vibrio vulnificus]|nr:polysaccharide biosynthesis protein [Vibrio vulnificus]
MSTNKIFKNTIVLYLRQLLIIFVSLYTVRVVLSVLGVQEYGIYMVVSGIVTLCSFLSGSMSSATQRYFSFALGKRDEQLLKSTFTVNFFIYITIAVFAFLLLQTVGDWFVKDYINIPNERKGSALILFNYASISFVLSILTSPLIAVIIAHENMRAYAYISIVEVVMKLGVVIILSHIEYDKLELYGFLLLCVAFINLFLYLSYTMVKYEEIQFRKLYWNKFLLKEIISFTSWTLFGQFTTVARSQAVTILVNQFFNPSVVASKAIASTVASQVNMFSNNFNTGIYPPIIKSYAESDYKRFRELLYNGSKLTFCLYWVFFLPLTIEIEFIFKIWLGQVPEKAVLFTRLALVEALIFSISLPLTTAARAPGKMKSYELTLGILQVFIFILSYLALNYGFGAYMVFVVAIAVNIAMFFVRLIIVSKLVELSINDFYKRVLIPIAIICIVSLIPCIAFSNLMPEGSAYSLINIILSGCFSCLVCYTYGLDKEDKKKLINIIVSKLVRE